MSRCKYCDEEIIWEETSVGWRPMSYSTGKRHYCKAEKDRAKRPVQELEADRLRGPYKRAPGDELPF